MQPYFRIENIKEPVLRSDVGVRFRTPGERSPQVNCLCRSLFLKFKNYR
jgi:hypothetical protein